MHILVERVRSDDDATLSIISIDGKFECFGLEDEYRETKVPAETRIPAGTYQVGVRDVGGFDNRYRNRFPDFHRGMLHILDVPNFEYILIHIGNTDEDTAGCLLVGAGCSTVGELSLSSSTVAYKNFYQKVIGQAANNNVTITFSDGDL